MELKLLGRHTFRQNFSAVAGSGIFGTITAQPTLNTLWKIESVLIYIAKTTATPTAFFVLDKFAVVTAFLVRRTPAAGGVTYLAFPTAAANEEETNGDIWVDWTDLLRLTIDGTAGETINTNVRLIVWEYEIIKEKEEEVPKT